jgi:hypothetical protein
MRQRTLLIALAAVAIIAAAGIAIVLQPDQTAVQRQQQGFTVSFAAAENAVGEDRENQLRDWARIGLAAHLDLDTQAIRDAFFDAFPIRDNGFADLARQPTGPGRALLQQDTLHLLVPRDDVNDKRTAGLLLDQHRTDAGFALRAGVENPQGPTTHLLAELKPRAPPTGEYMTLTRNADGPPTARFGNTPPAGTPIQVHTPDGQSARLYVDKDQVTVSSADPLLGHNGAVEGAAMLRDIADTLAKHGETNGLLQAVRFGDVGAVIGKQEIFLSPPGHQWSTRVLEALDGDTTMRITDGRAIHVDRPPLHHVGTRKATLGEVLDSPGTTLYVNESFRATLATKDGPVAADALQQDLTVTIREVTAEKLHPVPADVRVHRDAEWSRVDTPPRIGVPTSPARPAGPAARILLICPEDDTANGCGD